MKSRTDETSTLSTARDNLEFWLEQHQWQVKEKNLILDRIRHLKGDESKPEWKAKLFKWLNIVELDMETMRGRVENATEIYNEIKSGEREAGDIVV